MRAWMLAFCLACGSEEERELPSPEPPPPELPPPPEEPEPPPVPMGWAPQSDQGVRYAMPPEWRRVPAITNAMVFSWQGPESPDGRIAFHLSRSAHVQVAAPADLGDVTARELGAQGATGTTNEVVRDWSGAEWAKVACTLRGANASAGARMISWQRVRPDGTSLRVGCSGPEGRASEVDATCQQLFEALVIE